MSLSFHNLKYFQPKCALIFGTKFALLTIKSKNSLLGQKRTFILTYFKCEFRQVITNRRFKVKKIKY